MSRLRLKERLGGQARGVRVSGAEFDRQRRAEREQAQDHGFHRVTPV